MIIDVGLLEIRIEKNKMIIDKMYISRVYRKLNHFNYINFKILQYLFGFYKNINNIEISINSRC